MLGALLGAGVLLFFVERESTPPVDNGIFEISVKNIKGSSLESTSETVRLIEETLTREPEIKHIISRIGYDEDELMARKGGDVGTHQATIRVVLAEERSAPTREVVARMRDGIRIREDIRVDIHMSEDVLGSLLSPGRPGRDPRAERQRSGSAARYRQSGYGGSGRRPGADRREGCLRALLKVAMGT